MVMDQLALRVEDHGQLALSDTICNKYLKMDHKPQHKRKSHELSRTKSENIFVILA